jgi:hypothetical protein
MRAIFYIAPIRFGALSPQLQGVDIKISLKYTEIKWVKINIHMLLYQVWIAVRVKEILASAAS